MKKTIAAIIALMFASSAAAGDVAAPKDAIISQEKAWAQALLDGDLNAVADLMHRDFRLVRAYSDAPPFSKEMYLSMDGMSAYAADVTSVTITEDAGAIAVARVTWTMDWSQEGVGKLPPYFDMIDTWVKGDDGEWRILSRISQIADAPYNDNE
ncbi:MAG: nuclear transport factor 2 family protein [Marinicaulis sp.]|nr:nuclear transport factor 2 family protein [Marinicaulis sp.]